MSTALSRRVAFGLGAGALVASLSVPEIASAQARAGEGSENETIVRKWYKLWETEKTNWGPFDALLADDFTFTSAAPDDHISKAAFKQNCWDTQIGRTGRFDLELVMAKGDFVFVKWVCITTGGKRIRDVELHQLRDGRIKSIECYFGAPAGFPTAAESKKS